MIAGARNAFEDDSQSRFRCSLPFGARRSLLMGLTGLVAFSSLLMLFYSPSQQFPEDCKRYMKESSDHLTEQLATKNTTTAKTTVPPPPPAPIDPKDRFYTGNFTKSFYEVATDRGDEILGSGFRGRDVGLTPMHYAKEIEGWDKKEVSKMIVMARAKEDISWLDTYLQGVVPHVVYTVDDNDAGHKVPKNSGNEAMIFLTYIIDNYDNLPDSVTFIHGHRSAWHQFRGLNKDVLLNNLKWGRFHYANLRCDQVTVGHMCPKRPELSPGWMQDETRRYASMWDQLFAEDLGPMPPFVDDICCAEFMVSREAIRVRTKAFYEKSRNWLMTTDWPSANSGRIFEHAWHMIFGMPPRFGNPRDCAKMLYGL